MSFINKIVNIITELCNWLISTDNSELSITITIINISVTALILILTLSINPFDKISEHISGDLYDYLIDNYKFKKPIQRTLVLCVIQIILFPFIPVVKLTIILYSIFLLIILHNIYTYSKSIKEQLDIAKTCYPIIEERLENIVVEFLNEERIYNSKIENALEKGKQEICDSILFQEPIDDFPLGKPRAGYDIKFKYEIDNIYDLVLSALEKSKYSSYEKSIESLFRCFKIYFKYINNHMIIVDNVFIDFMDISRTILKISQKHTNRLFADIFVKQLFDLVIYIRSLNLNKDFYFNTLLKFFFENIIFLNIDDYVVGVNKYDSLISLIFSDEKVYKESFETCIIHLTSLQKIIYNQKDALNKTHTNKLINSFCYYILLNDSYLYSDDFINEIIKLQKSIDTNNTLAPIPGNNDFSTTISIYGTDKTIYSIIHNYLFNKNYECTDEKLNLIRLKNVTKQINILKERYMNKTLRSDGIIKQLFCIYFDIFAILDEFVFNLLKVKTDQEIWTIHFKDFEKKIYINFLLDIFKFTITNTKTKNDDIIFSEFKLLHIVLSDKNLSQEKEYNIFIKQNITKLIIDSNNISNLMKIEILRIIEKFYPRKEKNELLKHIKSIKKEIDKDAWSPYIKTEYDKTIFARSDINYQMLLMTYVVEYINCQTFYHFNYIKEHIKEKILSLPQNIHLDNVQIYFKDYSPNIIRYALQELLRDGKINITENKIIR